MKKRYFFYCNPKMRRSSLCINEIFYGGDDWRNFEPISRPRTTVSFNRVNKIVMDLRRIYKENPAYFDIPAFAQKVY